MKLEFTEEDMELIRMMLLERNIHSNNPDYDEYFSDILYKIASMLHKHPEYIATSPGLKATIIKRSIYTTMAKGYSKKRANIFSASMWLDIDDNGLMAVPSTADARIDAQRTFDLLPERAKEVVVSRILGNSDAEFAAEKNISRQGVWVNMRRDTKKVKKELK